MKLRKSLLTLRYKQNFSELELVQKRILFLRPGWILHKQFYICIILMAILCCYAVSSRSQTFKFKNLSTDNGLSDRWIRCIIKDNRGFMWFSTANGLSRYDGVEFKIFKREFDNPASLCNNSVNALFMDSNHNIWVGTQNGLSVFNQKTENFFSYFNNPADATSLGGVSVSEITEDHEKNIWIATSNGLDLFIPETQNFKHFRNDPLNKNSLINNVVNDIEIDTDGNLWIATKDGADFLNIAQNNFTHFKDQFGRLGDFVNHITKLHLDEDGNMWLGTLENGLCRFNRQSFRFEKIKWDVPTTNIKDLQILSIKHDHNGKLYAGTPNGLWVSDSTKSHFIGYASDDGKIGNIIGASIWSIYCDHQDRMLWLGTDIGGVVYASNQRNTFKLYTVKTKGKSRKTVFSMTEDNEGNIWMATPGSGVSVINKETGKIQQYTHTNNGTSLATDAVITVEKDNTGNIWLGTYLGGLELFDKKNKKFIHFTRDPNNRSSLSGGNVYDIHADSQGKIWIATDKGLDLYNPENGLFSSYHPILTDPDNERNNWIRQIVDGRDGNLLIMTLKSIQVFNIKQQTFSRLSEEIEKKIDNAQYLLLDSKDNLWIGTNNGLFWVNKDKTAYKIFSEKEGFPSNYITAMLEDEEGNLWITTRGNGLFKFENAIHNQQNLRFTIFSEDDGLQSKVFESRSAYKGKDNTLYFGGENGINVFNPDKISGNKNAPPVVITKLRIFNKDVDINNNSPLTNSIIETDTLTLSYADYVFSLNFAALNYMRPDQNQYSYILENFDKDWNYVNNTNTATYTNLNPGVYTFRVKASNNYGVWNETGKSLRIVVTPPYWQTWWFISCLALFISGSLALFFKVRIDVIRRQRLLLEQQVEERTKQLERSMGEERNAREDAEKARLEAEQANRAKSTFLATMSHEIRTPMNGVIGMASLLTETLLTQEQQEYTETIRSCGENLLGVINDILDFSKIESGKMELEEKDFDLRGCIEEVLDVFAGKAASTGVDLVYQLDYEVPAQVVGDGLRLRQVLMNLVSNAIKFTNQGEIFVGVQSLKKDEDKLELSFHVRDTGIGIPEDKLGRLFKAFSQVDSSTTRKYGGTGLGLVISEKLVKLMGGEIQVQSQPGSGTTFTFTISSKVSVNPLPTYVTYNMSGLEGKKILVVDDNLTNRNILKTQLEIWKLVPTLASSGSEALVQLKTSQFDLVLTDMQMPEMDGIQLAQAIKKSNPHTAIILLSSIGDERGKSYSEYFSSVLTKPVKQSTLCKHILKDLRKNGKTLPLEQTVTSKLNVEFGHRHPLRILIAEDNAVNQKLAQRVLNKLGYQPHIVGNGKEALKVLERDIFDVILMDVQMPEMDGLEATRCIRESMEIQPVIIAMTANAMKEDRDICLEAGMDDYISKPIQLEILIKALEKWSMHLHNKRLVS